MPNTIRQPRRGGKAGMGVDSLGGPVIDPTENVISLVEAEAKRQDDLRRASKELTDEKVSHQGAISGLIAKHADVLARVPVPT